MAAVAKQPTIGPDGTLAPGGIPTSQLTPNFFNSIFNDGMNPFDECFGSLTPGTTASLLASTLRKEHNILSSEKPKVLKDETLPSINTRLDQTLTPEQSPKSLSVADASIPTQLSLSRSPSPFTFSVNATFPQSPVSSVTPITSPEDMTPTEMTAKESEETLSKIKSKPQKVSRKSLSVIKTNNSAPAHKRNLSLPQSWDSAIPSMTGTVPLVPTVERGIEVSAKPKLRSKSKTSAAPLPQLVSRMDGIFVSENIPLNEVKAEPDSPTMAGFHSINTQSSAGRKRKRSATVEEEDDDEDCSHLNESEKRARFLERNRIAASKCRKKKKLMNQRLEDKSRLLVQQNRFLSATLAKLRSDVLRLKQMVLTHHACGHAPIEQYLHREAGKYLAADGEDAAKKLKEDTKLAAAAKSAEMDGVLKPQDIKLPAWLNEFHSFEEVESEALKRSSNFLDFDDEDFQKLLLGDQLTMMDDEFGTSPPYE